MNISLLEFSEVDLDFIYKGLSHPDVIKYYGFQCYNFDDAIIELDWYNKQVNEQLGHWWKIQVDNELVGAVGFNHFIKESGELECGFWLLPEFWGRGIIKQAFPIALRRIQNELPVKTIVASVETENIATLKLVKKLGFFEIKTVFNAEFKKGKPINMVNIELPVW